VSLSEYKDLPDELRRLIEAACDGTLDEQGLAKLEERLRGDASAARAYLIAAHLHADLKLMAVQQESLDATLAAIGASPETAPLAASRLAAVRDAIAATTRNVVQFFAKPTPLSMSVAALTVGLIVTAMALTAPPIYRALTGDRIARHADPVFVAQLSGSRNAEWAKHQVGAILGSYLPAGQRMELTSGLVEVTYHSGATAVVEGPAIFTLNSKNSTTLDSGKLLARVPAAAIGFSVRTEQAIVTDLGTEFGVEVDDQRSTTTQVIKGAVQVASVYDPASSVRLEAGQACIAVPGQRRLARLAKVDPKRFARVAAHLHDETVTVQVNFRDPNEPKHTAPGWHDVTQLSGPVGFLKSPIGRSTDIQLEIVDGFGWLWPNGLGVDQAHRASNGVIFPAAVLTDLGGENYYQEELHRNGIAVLRLSSLRQYDFTMALAAAVNARSEKTLCNVRGSWDPAALTFRGGSTAALMPDDDGDSVVLVGRSQWDDSLAAYVIELNIADGVRNGIGAAGISAIHITATLVEGDEMPRTE
jgi:hypothetical protein